MPSYQGLRALVGAVTDYRDASGYLVGRYMRLHENKPVHDLEEAHEWFASTAAKLDALAADADPSPNRPVVPEERSDGEG